ncbi:hypothetical protein [Fibrobacter sp.]|uniref:hypothetical protein n=1 Tax=Fibrobacter sp. TaxID=35828 RepID=UPI00388D48FE
MPLFFEAEKIESRLFLKTKAADEDPCAKQDAFTEIDDYYQIGTCGDLLKFAEMANTVASLPDEIEVVK